MPTIRTEFRECSSQIFHVRDRCKRPKMHRNPKNSIEQAAVYERAKVANQAVRVLLYKGARG